MGDNVDPPPANDDQGAVNEEPDRRDSEPPEGRAHAAKEGGTQPGSDGQPGVEKPAETPEPEEDRLGNVHQEFQNVWVEHGHFGISGNGPVAQPRMTGRLEEAVVARIVQAYAEPACYAEAADVLREERIVVLSGPTGSGRRAAAINLLARARAPGAQLVGLSPAIGMEKMAVRSFDEGSAYLVTDMFDEMLLPEMADFHWRTICHNIRKSKAYLVVTVGAGSRIIKCNEVRHVPWQRPEAADVLKAYLDAAMVEDKIIDRVAEALGPGYPLSEMKAIAGKVSGDEDIEAVLTELQNSNRLTVANWLDETEREIPAVLEVAALAFVLGVPERLFEAELLELRDRMAVFAPETDTKSKKARIKIDLRFRQLRKDRASHSLLIVRHVPVAGGSSSLTVRYVDFRMATYQEHLIAELWARVGAEFWHVIREWLHRIAKTGHLDLVNRMAYGLALLSLVAPDEVIDSYLDPWIDEGASQSEQTTAVYVLWQMSMLGQVAPLALQIAIDWVRQGKRKQRRAATYAFSGELGARYPTEAVTWLSRLAERGEPQARQAYALLFATLAERGNDAAIVLLEMKRRMTKKTPRPKADRLSDTILDLVSIEEPRSGRPAVVVFLLANPQRTDDVAALWAHVLCLRPWRERAVTALVKAIGAIEHGHAVPETPARSLGAAIGRNLPPGERGHLRPEVLAARRAKEAKDPVSEDPDPLWHPAVSESLLNIFLTACEMPFQKEVG